MWRWESGYRLPSLPFGSERHITSDATEELKLDGYRAIAFTANGKVHLRSRNDKDFSTRYAAIAAALEQLPDETVIDGQVVANGRLRAAVLQRAAELRRRCTGLLLRLRCAHARGPRRDGGSIGDQARSAAGACADETGR